jgi:phenylalanyl-tRNA synthetase beta chain
VKLPIAWLRDYIDVSETSDQIAERFAALGFPVESIERRQKLSGVVIGRIAKTEKHPNADTLTLCTIDIGVEQTLTIATAATNVAAGDVIPVATIGAEVVGLSIGRRKMRGIDSEGMLCSAGELGLEGDWFEDGILQLEHDLPLGADFIERYRLNDDVLDVEVTANRPDCLSVVGLARELAASLGQTIAEPQTHAVSGTPAFTAVAIESADCKRFVAQRFSGLTVGPSPFWMRARLALAGQRPIDNLVDISNFVMLEIGQPLHFYDFEKLAGEKLIVRDARAGEAVRTLDESERRLDGRFLVIADANEPQCVAGLMGAAASEVTATTRELLLEAATFSGPRVRRMSVALGLRTEASTRHEKGLPLGLSTWGAARATQLLADAGATAHAPFATGASDEPAAPIELDLARITSLLGVPVTQNEATSALRSLGFGVIANATNGYDDAKTLAITAPLWRADIRIPEDVVEEIARVVGYDRIVAEMPPVLAQTVTSDAYRAEKRVAHAFAGAGYREAVTFALQPGGIARAYERAQVAFPGEVVEITNPLSEDQRYLRFSLLPALLELAAKYARDEPYRAFEIGHVFAADGEAPPLETAGVAWLLALPAQAEPAWQDAGFLQFKAESLAIVRALTGSDAQVVTATLQGYHPGKTAQLLTGGRDIATIGAVDPRLADVFDVRARVYAGWMRFADLPSPTVPRYAAPSRYPAIARDLSLVVAPEIPALDIEHAIRAGSPVVTNVRVFDEYRGPQIAAGKKSLAVRIVLQSHDATLTDGDAETQMKAVVASLRERCDAQIRE